MTITRDQLSAEEVDGVLAEVRTTILHRLDQKGWGAMVSAHEALGHVTEEYHELVEAVHQKDGGAMHLEALDLAVACLVLVMSRDPRTW